MARKTRGLSTTLTLLGIGTCAAAIAAYSTVAFKTPTPTLTSTSQPNDGALGDAMLLQLAGLDAEACAAAGLTVEQTQNVAAQGRQYLANQGRALQNAYRSHRQAASQLKVMEQSVRQGHESRAVERQRANVESTSDLLRSLLAAASTAATQGLSDSQVSKLAALGTARAVRLPTAYNLVERSEAQAVALRDALADARIAQRQGRETPAESARIIQSAQADAGTSTALSHLTNIGVYRQAWSNGLKER